MVHWLGNLRTCSLPGQTAVLIGVALGVFALVAPFAWWLTGWAGVGAASVAVLACLGGAVPALVLGRLLRRPELTLIQVLTSSAARMGIPLAIGLAFHFRGGALAEAGLLYYLVVFYPATLVAEITLSLPVAKAFSAKVEPPAVDES
ncbi:MAG: hypothetical protein ABFC63_11565 [Thermoguttaceae bacterium]